LFKIKPKTKLEKHILSNIEIQQGFEYGQRRKGHPEGAVKNHIIELLEKVEKIRNEETEKAICKLRFMILMHDSLKHKVDRSKPKIGENNHGMLARRFAEKLISDEVMLSLIELHDLPYYTWQGRVSDESFKQKIKRIQPELELFIQFIILDTSTGDKNPQQRILFYEKLLEFGFIKKERLEHIIRNMS
jgi:hypothetical protein